MARLPRMRANRSSITLALVCILWLASGATALAAEGDYGRLLMTRLDVSRVPLIDIYAVVEDSSGGPVSGLQAVDFQLAENGTAIANPKVNSEKVGLQLAIAIDAGTSSTGGSDPGAEVRSLLSQYLLAGSSLDTASRSDWIAVFAQDQSGIKLLTEDAAYPRGWTNDYQMVENKIYQFSPSRQMAESSLANVMATALSKMEEVAATDDHLPRQRVLVTFSDDKSGISRSEYQSLLNAARRARVSIYPVVLGKVQDEPRVLTLLDLASATGGLFAETQSAGSLRELADALGLKHDQYHIQYRIVTAGNHDLVVQANIDKSGLAMVRQEISFVDNLAAPALKIGTPSSTLEKDSRPGLHGLPLSLQILWPHDEARRIVETRFVVDQMPYVVTDAPFDRFVVPFDRLADGSHKVRAELIDEVGLRATSDEVSIQVSAPRPLVVALVAPASGATLRRMTTPWWAGILSLPQDLANVQTVESIWQSPDGSPRRVERVEYLVDGSQQVPSADVTSRFRWNISQIPDGPHVLQVRVTDEFGLLGESNPVSVRVEKGTPWILNVVPPSVAVLLLAATTYLLYRRRPISRTVVRKLAPSIARDGPGSWLSLATAGRGRSAFAYLSVERGDVKHNEPIPLFSANTRIGRDERLVNLQFADRSVSRLHARISKEPNGTFYIYDEGSTSGTLVNDQPVPITGRLLHPNDTIVMGRLCLRFSFSGVQDEAWLAARTQARRTGFAGIQESETQDEESLDVNTERLTPLNGTNGLEHEAATDDEVKTMPWRPGKLP